MVGVRVLVALWCVVQVVGIPLKACTDSPGFCVDVNQGAAKVCPADQGTLVEKCPGMPENYKCCAPKSGLGRVLNAGSVLEGDNTRVSLGPVTSVSGAGTTAVVATLAAGVNKGLDGFWKDPVVRTDSSESSRNGGVGGIGGLLSDATSTLRNAVTVGKNAVFGMVVASVFQHFTMTATVEPHGAARFTKHTSHLYVKVASDPNEMRYDSVIDFGSTKRVLTQGKRYMVDSAGPVALDDECFLNDKVTADFSAGFVLPEKIVSAKAVPELQRCCSNCTLWSGRFKGTRFVVAMDADNKPKCMLSRDTIITVTKFTPNARSADFTIPASLKESKCLAPDDELRAQGTEAPPLPRRPNGFHVTARASVELRGGNEDFALMEERSEESVQAPGITSLLGKPDFCGNYRIIAPGWLDFLTTTYLWFREVDHRWQWTPYNPCQGKSVQWMSVSQMVVLSGSYKGKAPVADNQATINKLQVFEQAGDKGNFPMTKSEIKTLLGDPINSAGNQYAVKVSWASTLYFKQANDGKWFWSPWKDGKYDPFFGSGGTFWFSVQKTTVTGTGSSYDGEKPNEWNVRTIKELARQEKLKPITNPTPTSAPRATPSPSPSGGSGGEQPTRTEKPVVDNPNPSELTSCTTAAKGDGYCDRACNTKAHNWDNGDCCAGTCITGVYSCGSNGYDCKADAKQKVCLFLHGLGKTGPSDGRAGPIGQIQGVSPPGTTDYGVQYYWGDMKKELEGVCTNVLYNHADTVNNRWDSKALADFYYNEAKKVYKQGGVVFAHSMANVILAGACLNDPNRCDVKWYDVQGPLRGSAAATNRDSKFARLYFGLKGEALNVGTTSMFLTAKGMKQDPDESTRDAVSRTAYQKQLLKGVMCGMTGMGAGYETGSGLAQAKFLAYGNYRCVDRFAGMCIKYEPILADGFVGMDECEMFGYKEAGSWQVWYTNNAISQRNSRAPNFRTLGNHQDGTGVHGNFDGIMDWYRTMARTDDNKPH